MINMALLKHKDSSVLKEIKDESLVSVYLGTGDWTLVKQIKPKKTKDNQDTSDNQDNKGNKDNK